MTDTRADNGVTETLNAEHLLEEGAAFVELGGFAGQSAAVPAGAEHADRNTRSASRDRERFDVVVIGGGQAGLSAGYHLAQRGLRFVILDANARIGDSWRKRWDSLRLFTPARFDGLDGMPFPAPPDSFPTKDEMADYLEAYAARFELPVRSGVRVDKLSRLENGYLIEAGDVEIEADQVVVAMAKYQKPKVPDCAREIEPGVTQLHSSEYRNPSQLQRGPVLIAGAGNSGAEIGVELARHHRVWLSGRDVGQIPFQIDGFWGRLFLVRLVLRFVFHRLLSIRTPIGRKIRPKVLHIGGPLIRTKWKHLLGLGVQRAPKVVGTRDGKPLFDDGRVLDVANIVWCTGFHGGFSWIDVPIFDEHGEPRHEGGVVQEAPGLYFVGLHFLYSLSSTMIHAVGRDAARVADVAAARARAVHPVRRRPRALLARA